MSNFLGTPLSPRQPEVSGVTKYNQKVLQKKALKINKQMSKQTKNPVIQLLNIKSFLPHHSLSLFVRVGVCASDRVEAETSPSLANFLCNINFAILAQNLQKYCV